MFILLKIEGEMRNEKVFTFGNGGVLVHASWINQYIELTQIKPPTGYIGTIKKKT